MANGIYIGVSGKARQVKGLYIGVGGKARKVVKAYVGVGGKARLIYQAAPPEPLHLAFEYGGTVEYSSTMVFYPDAQENGAYLELGQADETFDPFEAQYPVWAKFTDYDGVQKMLKAFMVESYYMAFQADVYTILG